MDHDSIEALFHETIQCYVLACEYDFATKRGILHVNENSCTDMTGTINFFKSIDAKVEFIEVFAGKKSDIIYVCIKKKWEAREFA